MSEYFSGITFPQQKVTPSDDASIRRSVLADGILSGCEISYIGSTLTFGAGLLIGCGRQFRHTTVQNFAVTGATSGFARLVVTIDTTKASTKYNFDQIDAAIEYAAVLDGFTQLRQDDINESGTVYQMQICVVSLGAGGISGIVSSVGKTGGIQSTPKAGFIYPLASAVVPDGFLLCDGAAYARSEYPELFAAIGTMYGSGDGATTFNVPDLRNRVPAGASENHPAGEMVGEETHQTTLAETASHKHATAGYHAGEDVGYPVLNADKGHLNASYWNFQSGDYATTYSEEVGGNQPHNNMQPTTYIRGYIIATGKGTGVSVADIIMGAQALPLGLEYGGVGATDPKTARENLEITPENIGALSMELLWKNASPTSSFESQNISLPSTAYPFYLARFRLRNDADWYENVIAAPYEYTIASVPTTHANVAGGNIYNRRFAVSPDTAYLTSEKCSMATQKHSLVII